MNKRKIYETVRRIIQDKTSGSTCIASRIENIFPFIPEDIFEQTIRKFLVTHSSMASVINMINYLCLQREGKKVTKINISQPKMFLNFWNEHQNKMNWITLSMSFWVIECFKKSKKKRKLKVGISYPDKEGLITYNLLKDIHHIEIYEDSRLISEVEKSDGIILGADFISKKFITNKTGSFSLSIAAHFFKKPLYIISSGDKFLSNNLIPFYKVKFKKYKSRLIHYFENIPMELITKIYLSTSVWDFPLSETLKKIAKQN